MLTVRKLFWQRLAGSWKFQISVWKTVVDWVVALYIVIPFSAIFINAYLNWWKNIPPELNYFPLNVFLGIILVFSWTGTPQIFLADADQIFLFQRKVWIKGLIKYSVTYYIIFTILVTLLALTVLAPFFLLHYGFTWHSFIWFTGITLFLKADLGIMKQLLQFRFQGWKYVLINTPIVVVTGVFFRQTVSALLNHSPLFPAALIVLLAALVGLLYLRFSLKGTLLEDIAMRQAGKLKFANVLLRYAGTYTKKPVTFRTRPWLFRNSRLLFKRRTPETGLVELCLKANLRHTANLKFYLEVLAADILLIAVFPSPLKWLLWLVFIFLLTEMVKPLWLETVNSSFVSLFPLSSEITFKAANRSLFLMAAPGEVILGLLVLLQTRQWLYALILIPVGFLLSKFIAKKLAMFS